MIADERIGGTFRNSSTRLQGTVAGSVFGFVVSTTFKVCCVCVDVRLATITNKLYKLVNMLAYANR